MSQALPPPPPVEDPAPCPPERVRRVAPLPPTQRVTLWFRRARTRAHLAQLGAEALRDIGVTEAERRAECGLWFWRGMDR
ncbi:DUF1127 domain-containing protein [Rhodobacter maris]|uniref:Uncharacterized protein YjiS n=1 Tax=Rhodobacter maris TaxID=446682 RepID=A0A285SFT5_9RHOB|nr:DUF1127 domain-containing protein [Rhodobacter maris]SOC04741.1 uncharacterized protein YjiS [Rhodobacter maris]